jgi:hypothetical protein
MIIPPFGLCRRKLNATPDARIAAYSDDDRACKLRHVPCNPCANCLKLKEIWTMIRSCGLFVFPQLQFGPKCSKLKADKITA